MAGETRHPDPEVLEAFALGRSGVAGLERVETHLAGCPTCVQAVLAVPMDHLVGLLRRTPSRTATSPDAERAIAPPTRGRHS